MRSKRSSSNVNPAQEREARIRDLRAAIAEGDATAAAAWEGAEAIKQQARAYHACRIEQQQSGQV